MPMLVTSTPSEAAALASRPHVHYANPRAFIHWASRLPDWIVQLRSWVVGARVRTQSRCSGFSGVRRGFVACVRTEPRRCGFQAQGLPSARAHSLMAAFEALCLERAGIEVTVGA